MEEKLIFELIDKINEPEIKFAYLKKMTESDRPTIK